MVKVVIDKKMYEGSHVDVYYTNEEFFKEMNDFSTCHIEIKKEEPKEIPVPKEIQFVEHTNREINKLSLRVGDYMIVMQVHDDDKWNWGFTHKENYAWYKPVDCVLVLIKQEELKAGDWAFGIFPKDCIEQITAGELKDLENYVLWLGNGRVVNVFEEKEEDDGTDYCARQITVKEYETNELVWFKVVPKSEVDRQKSILAKGLMDFHTKNMNEKAIREFFPAREVAKELHNAYEQASKEYGWKTQKKCQVDFDFLPEKNRDVMLRMAYLVQDMIEKECQKAIVDYLEDESKTIIQGFEMSWQQAKPRFEKWVKKWLEERYTKVKMREQSFT